MGGGGRGGGGIRHGGLGEIAVKEEHVCVECGGGVG